MSNGVKDSFGKSDLFLLLESYRNTFESNTILLEQQKQLIEQWKSMAGEQEKMTVVLERIVDKIDKHTEIVKDYHVLVSQEGGKIRNRINYLYIGIGAIIVPFIAYTYEIVSHINILKELADYMAKMNGVG